MKTSGSPVASSQPGELVDVRGRRRDHRRDRPDDRRPLGLGGHRRDRPGRQQATDQPHDEQALGQADERSAQPIEAAQEPVTEAATDRSAETRADRLADPDRQEQAKQDADGPQGRLDPVEQAAGIGQGEDGHDQADRRPGEAEDLGEEPGAPAGDEGEGKQDDDPEVDEIHRPKYPRAGGNRLRTRRAGRRAVARRRWLRGRRSSSAERPRRRRSASCPGRGPRGRRRWP